MDDLVNQIIQSIPLLTQALGVAIFFMMTGLACMLTWVVMRAFYPPFAVKAQKYDAYLNPMFSNALSPVFSYISSIITGVFSNVVSVIDFGRSNLVLVIVLIGLSGGAYLWNTEHHKLIPYVWEIQQCYEIGRAHV